MPFQAPRRSQTEATEKLEARRRSSVIEKLADLPDEEIWDYPLPPKVEKTKTRVQVYFNGLKIADDPEPLRVLHKGRGPVYFLHRDKVMMENIGTGMVTKECEYKGLATYVTIEVGSEIRGSAGYFFEYPSDGYQDLLNTIAFVPGKVGVIYIDGEKVLERPNDEGHYTHNIKETKREEQPSSGVPPAAGKSSSSDSSSDEA